MHRKTIIDFKELGKRYSFTDPLYELKAEKIGQVGRVLEAVEKYQREGYYVVGYLSYEAAAYFDPKMETHQKQLYKEYFAYFTVHHQAQLEAFPSAYERVDMPNSWESLVCQKAYEEAIQEIRHHIRQGNTYQVNYTIQMRQAIGEDSLAIYNRLMVEQAAAYNAYISHDDVSVLSISPELFFKRKGNRIITRPMKGTAGRGLSREEDQAQAAWLQADEKNRAENMMIVDLLRNDLGKICQVGSVKVTSLCELEKYSTVWQLTSTIEGRLRDAIRMEEIFSALYPCGSITGAPKLSTMAIIKQLEPNPRGVYCGAIGLCLPHGDMIFNVPIRTVQLEGKEANYGVGGGITWDSYWQAEYAETQEKMSILYRQTPHFNVLTTAKLMDGQLTFLDEHLNRLRQASSYFSYPFDEASLRMVLAGLCQEKSKGNYRVKIELDKAGHFHTAVTPLKDLPAEFFQARVVRQSQDFSSSPFTFFKTSYRPHRNSRQQEEIYVNPDGWLLETSIGNLVLDINGQLYTPLTRYGLLSGIYRNHLLKTQKIKEKALHLRDLYQADKVYACNAVRGLYELTLERDRANEES